jgi:titin
VGANVTTYTNTGLSANTQYYYRIRATNAAGASAYSAEANATTLPFPPAAPSALAATALSSTSIRINWTDNANNETQFKIERKTGAGGTYAQVATVGANVTTYTNTGLSAATTYFYRVRANNAGGDSAYSAEASATTQSGCGALPSPYASQDIGAVGFAGGACYAGTTFTIRASGADIWDAADAFHFVHRSWTGNVEVIARVVSVQATDSWAKSGVMIRESLNANSIHALMVMTPGNGSSFQRRTTTGGGSAHSTPGDGTAAPHWVRLVRNGTTFTGYHSSDGSNWVQVGSDTITMASTFRIGIALTAHNNGLINTSVVDNLIVRVPSVSPPAAPSGLAATPISTSQINLNWTDNANNETGFEIERKTGAGGTYSFVGGTGANVTSFPDSGLSPNTTYFYRVRAINTGGNSAFSPEASATTQSSGTGTGLVGDYFSNQNLTGFPTLTRTDATVDFNWGTAAPHASLPADGFSVRWSGKVQPQFSETYTFYTYTDDGARLWVNGVQLVNDWNGHPATENSGAIALVAGQQYNITMEFFDGAVDAVARLSWSSASTPKAVIPQSRLYPPSPPTIPAAPSGLAATAVSGAQINLTWIDNANNETQFKVERKTGAGGTYAQIATPGANATTYIDTTVSANITYYYRVRANNSAGDSPYSNEANATTPAGGSVAPVIFASGYDNILQLQITGTPGNWRLHDLSTRTPQAGYEWWYIVGSKIVKTSSNLTNEPWMGNHPGRVLKMGGKIGLDTFNRWNWTDGGSYYDPNAGMSFERGDTGGFTTFMFR